MKGSNVMPHTRVHFSRKERLLSESAEVIGLILVGENGDELMVALELIADCPAHMVLMSQDQISDDLVERLEYEAMSD